VTLIRCLGCGETFDSLEEYKRHQWHADHPDNGEVFPNVI
jgi:uncharacterized C2H2 Zn-finger protein